MAPPRENALMPINLPFLPRRRDFPPDLWTKCPSCGEMLYNKQLERNLRVCPKCGHHFRLRADTRLRLLLDPDSFEEHDAGLESADPLGFVDLKPYPDRLAAARISSGLRDAAVWGTGRIDGQPVAICVMDFAFIGGSMGSVVGEKVTRAAEHALAESVPLVIVSASGGARMQEGTLALMQLAKTCAALERLAAAGVPFLSIMTDPTTGGVFASFAVLGDVNLAEPDALIRFAGERVASGTIAVELPPGYQRAEFLLEHGFLDRVVPRDRLREEVARLLCYLREGTPCAEAPFPPGEPLARATGEGREAAFRPFGFLPPRLPNLPVVEAGRRSVAALGAQAAEIGAHAAEVIGGRAPGDGTGPHAEAPSGTAPGLSPAAPTSTPLAAGGPGSGAAPASPASVASTGSASSSAQAAPAASSSAQVAPAAGGAPPVGTRRSSPAAFPSSAPDAAEQERAWARVQAARNVKRPHTLELIRAMASDVVELQGDRLFGDDPAIVGGLARIPGHAFVFVGHQRGSETEENIRRNFGMAHPEGYRKAMRLFTLAERFHLPVVTFVDTGGAYPGPASEERGVAEAIARSIAMMTRLQTPIVTVITGEGGSGGALAIATGDVVLALENAIYSVISPEGCASILWRDPAAARQAAASMHLTAPDQLALGVVDEVIPEPPGGAQEDPVAVAASLAGRISDHLARLEALPIQELVDQRYARYRSMGAFTTVERELAPAGRRPDLASRLRDLIEAGRATLGVPEPGPARTMVDEDADAPLREEF
ncbi:MAG: acetyl-CoA carboxylase carboxyltransferase subunit alpha [Candidatus Limnocylindrales bacterium]